VSSDPYPQPTDFYPKVSDSEPESPENLAAQGDLWKIKVWDSERVLRVREFMTIEQKSLCVQYYENLFRVCDKLYEENDILKEKVSYYESHLSEETFVEQLRNMENIHGLCDQLSGENSQLRNKLLHLRVGLGGMRVDSGFRNLESIDRLINSLERS
jgi:hypothetical protein